jgi:hypothetical protein
MHAPDIDSFFSSATKDVYCAIGMDCSDGEWALVGVLIYG